jgi:hypothetical protein
MTTHGWLRWRGPQAKKKKNEFLRITTIESCVSCSSFGGANDGGGGGGGGVGVREHELNHGGARGVRKAGK